MKPPVLRYHQYKFIVDGTWRHDESQPYMPDPLGNVNNWLFVRRPEGCVSVWIRPSECASRGLRCTAWQQLNCKVPLSVHCWLRFEETLAIGSLCILQGRPTSRAAPGAAAASAAARPAAAGAAGAGRGACCTRAARAAVAAGGGGVGCCAAHEECDVQQMHSRCAADANNSI